LTKSPRERDEEFDNLLLDRTEPDFGVGATFGGKHCQAEGRDVIKAFKNK
jgi:hypothetical protein